jgi:hypothetical protein
MSHCKEVPKILFSEKLKKVEKLMTQREKLLAIKWCDVQDVNVFLLFFKKSEVAQEIVFPPL